MCVWWVVEWNPCTTFPGWLVMKELEVYCLYSERSEFGFLFIWSLMNQSESNESTLCMCRCWALALFGGNSESGFDQNTTYSIFSISITLSDEGFQNFFQVWKTLYHPFILLETLVMRCFIVVVGHSCSVPVSEDASVRWTSTEVRIRRSKPSFCKH